MKDITIKINQLGAVRDSEITIRPFMLFMGESGLGKSYVSFLAHYIYTLLSSDRVSHFFEEIDFNKILEDASNGDVIMRVSAGDLFKWINSDAISYIRYLIGHDNLDGDIEIIWPLNMPEITFTYREELEGLANSEEIIYSIDSDNFTYNKISDSSKIDARIFQKLIQAELKDTVFDEFVDFSDYILPPSRGALIELTERPIFRSGMYEEFFELKAALNRPLRIKKDEDHVLTSLISQANNGNVSQTENQIVYTTSEGVTMPLTAAASSVKELAPFTMLLSKFSLNKCSILFEEPEAHLHPERQQHVADLIGYALSSGCHMQVTTHSDYFIKRLNLLIRLYSLSRRNLPIEKMDSFFSDINVVPESTINPNNINAYYLTRRDDGSTCIEKYDIAEDNMIPFDSFHKTIMRDFDISAMIEEFDASKENDN